MNKSINEHVNLEAFECYKPINNTYNQQFLIRYKF